VIGTWWGAKVDIPKRWVLCDGTNGTPDLRDKFIVAAGSSYAVGNTGGHNTHDHPFTSDGHDHYITGPANTMPGVGSSLGSDNKPLTGTVNAATSLPEYYALCYIMYTGVT